MRSGRPGAGLGPPARTQPQGLNFLWPGRPTPLISPARTYLFGWALVVCPAGSTNSQWVQPTGEAFVGNRAKRRAWIHRVMSDPRLTENHRRLALTVAEMDRR